MFGGGAGWAHGVVLLGGAPDRLPGRVLLPGPGSTTRERAQRAVDPAARRRRAEAAKALHLQLAEQDQVDVAAAAELCPPTNDELRHAAAVLDLGVWRYKLDHTRPGPDLAALLAARPDELAPPAGTGRVVPAEHGAPGRAEPGCDEQWPDTILTSIAARHRLISHLQARQYADLAALSACYPGIEQFLATEVGLALHLTDTDAAALIGAALALRDRLPGTAEALDCGRIDDGKAHAMVRATANCPPEVAQTVERAVLPGAEDVTAATLRRRAARSVIAADPDGAAERHRRAVAERYVSRRHDVDGMAWLNIYASATDVTTMWEALTACADTLKRPADGRTVGNRRVDALTQICGDILVGGGWKNLRLPDKHRGPRVNVTIPYTVLLGHRAPCDLAGHGPITTEQALPLIGAGDLYRMICDPVTGQLLDYGRTRYKPPPHLAEFVRTRDGQCPMPTCDSDTGRGHLDHIVPAKPDPATGRPTHGTTDADNLAALCPHHHLAKDAGRGFGLHRSATGTYTWTTPLGRRYTWQPDPRWNPDTDALPAAGRPAGRPPDGTLTEPEPCRCPPTCKCQQSPAPWPDGLVPLAVDDSWIEAAAGEPETQVETTGPRDTAAKSDSTNPTLGYPSAGEFEPPPF